MTTLSACSIKSNSPSSYTTNTTAESSSKAQATQPAEQNYAVTNGTDTYRGFRVNNILHSENNSDIHFNLYVPKTYDGSKAYALFITLPGYEGLYFQGVGVNIRQENFGFEAQKYNSNMIIVAPQLNGWDEDSADETIVLVEYLLSTYNIDKLYCYDYVALGENADELKLEIDEYPCTRGERQTIVDSLDEQALDKLAKDTKTTTVKIPMSKQLKAVPYVNAKNGSLEISPISMKVDMTTGLGLSKDEAIEPYNCYYLSINYKDGTNYVVTEHEKEGEHTCDVDTDNAYYTLGDDAGQLSFVFNRLVDTDKIKSITVNNTDYTLK